VAALPVAPASAGPVTMSQGLLFSPETKKMVEFSETEEWSWGYKKHVVDLPTK
jgi:hypothetical protein